MASAMRAIAGMSWSSQIRSSMNGVISDEWWISACSVHTTAHPPSAFTARISAWAGTSRYPMPLQWGTWKKRLRAVTGPIGTGSRRTSKGEGTGGSLPRRPCPRGLPLRERRGRVERLRGRLGHSLEDEDRDHDGDDDQQRADDE